MHTTQEESLKMAGLLKRKKRWIVGFRFTSRIEIGFSQIWFCSHTCISYQGAQTFRVTNTTSGILEWQHVSIWLCYKAGPFCAHLKGNLVSSGLNFFAISFPTSRIQYVIWAKFKSTPSALLSSKASRSSMMTETALISTMAECDGSKGGSCRRVGRVAGTFISKDSRRAGILGRSRLKSISSAQLVEFDKPVSFSSPMIFHPKIFFILYGRFMSLISYLMDKTLTHICISS